MSKKRYLYFDLLSVIACLAVIFLHCNGIVHWGPQTPHWSQALAVEVGFYWAVRDPGRFSGLFRLRRPRELLAGLPDRPPS